MLQHDKNLNIVYSLYKREIGSYASTIRKNPKIIRRIIESEDTLYEKCWNKRSTKSISYEHGYMFYDNYSTIYTVYGPRCCPTKAFKMQTERAKERIIDIIVCSQPVVNKCTICTEKNCLCLKRYFVCLTKDQWLMQCSFKSGVAFKNMFVKSRNHAYGFGYCSWNVYGEQFTITSRLNPVSRSKVVGYMAVFTVSPFKLKWMFELSRDVFGKSLRSVNVSEQLLIAAVSGDQVHIYGFEDVLNEGVFLSAEDDSFGTGTKGIEINFSILNAPPVLFNVQCLGQSVQFGGYPYHCLFPKPGFACSFILRNLNNGNVPEDGCVESDSWWGESVGVSFHPDSSNRIIVQNRKSLHFHDIINDDNCVGLNEAFVIEFPNLPNFISTSSGYSFFGRKLKHTNYFSCERSIYAIDYEDEMNLIGVLGAHPNDPYLQAYIKLYDGSSGKEVKTVDLNGAISEYGEYQLNIDLDVIVVIVKDFDCCFRASVYRLSSTNDTS